MNFTEHYFDPNPFAWEEAPVKVWVLDVCGYDARGGNAQVFATLELAKAAQPDVEWEPERDSGEMWRQRESYPGSSADIWVIYPVEVVRRARRAS